MFKRLTPAVAGMLLAASALAAEPPVYATREGAIQGYDPVAYFTEQRAVKGEDRYTVEHDGATWRFASAENRDRFASSPESYAPQYGGYCAYAVGNGYTASTDPQAWSVVGGKLYLNYSKGVQRRWEARRADYIREGDANWPRVLSR